MPDVDPTVCSTCGGRGFRWTNDGHGRQVEERCPTCLSRGPWMSQLGGSGGVLVTAEAYGMALSIPGACPHCSSAFSATFHSGPCPRVKAIEYHPNGAVKRIEYKEQS